MRVHKLREAMASSVKALRIGGEGRTAEIDGARFGGHVRPANLAADRLDRRLAENQPGKRRVVVTLRERGGRTLAPVFPAEADAVAAIRRRIDRGTTVHADESPAWNTLHASFATLRLRLIKIAPRAIETATRVRIANPCPALNQPQPLMSDE